MVNKFLVGLLGFGAFVFADVQSTRDVLGGYCSNNEHILHEYDEVAQSWREYADRQKGSWDFDKLLNAVEFSAMKHEGQVRKDADKTPYIIHPIGVAALVWKIGNVRSVNVLTAALLHDTLEDTDATEEEIETLFGARVLHTVKEVTNDPALSGLENKLRQVEHAPMMSLDAQLVKLADRLYNVRDLEISPPNWSPEKVDEYYGWGEKLLFSLQGTNESLEAALRQMIAAHQRTL